MSWSENVWTCACARWTRPGLYRGQNEVTSHQEELERQSFEAALAAAAKERKEEAEREQVPKEKRKRTGYCTDQSCELAYLFGFRTREEEAEKSRGAAPKQAGTQSDQKSSSSFATDI